ncbi:MAG: transglutaminase domain-containing protein [Deltaproteobacteria bacterium]|nr:transglutaminase domain-containing protein [Deltaproteobacteria bacterium]
MRERGAADPVFLAEVALVVLGLFFVGWLFTDSYRQPTAPLAFSLDASSEGVSETWSGLYVAEEKIGYSVNRTASRDDGGLILQERTRLKLMLLGAPNEVTLANDVHIAPAGHVERLRSQVRTTVQGVPVTLRAEGRSTGGKGMELELFQAGVKLSTMQLDEVPATAATLYRAVVERSPKAGDRFSLPYFNPMSLGSAAAEVTVQGTERATQPDGVEVDAVRVEVNNSGQRLSVLIAPDGTRISEEEEEGGLGMRVLWETQEDALQKGWPADEADAVDLIALSSIPLDQRLPGGGRTISRLVLKVDGPQAVSDLLTRFHGANWDPATAQLTLERSSSEGAADFQLPSQDRAMQPWLRSTAFVQADDPKMVRAAGEALGDRLQAVAATEVLENWVYRTVEKVPVAGVPSASEVLASKRGDCNEHTTLFAALARSVGLPTRLAAGIVYSESIFADGAFYYHAWPEVWLGDRWFAVDPTFGQTPADATHVKLVEGELDKQTELMGVIGRLRLSVVEVQE